MTNLIGSWKPFLDAIDAGLKEPIELQCIGGFVLIHEYGVSRPTKDLDYLSIVPHPQMGELNALAGRSSNLAKQFKLFVEYVSPAVGTPPYDFEDRLSPMFAGTWDNLKLYSVELHDIILLKVQANRQVDFEDFLAVCNKLDFNLLRDRFEKELAPYVTGNPETHRLTLDLWIEAAQKKNSAPKQTKVTSQLSKKTAYLSPKEAELTVTIDRTARHLVAISLDLGIPRFTRFAISIPVQDMPGEEVIEYAHQAFNALLDEILLFMVSLNYEEQEMVQFTNLAEKCWAELSFEDATDADLNGVDAVLRMYEATFEIPASFVEETQSKVVTAAMTVRRMPTTRHLKLVPAHADPMDTTPARTIQMFRNRSLKSLPKPFYVLVYDQQGRMRGSIPLAKNWEKRLVKQA